ncbi:ParB N-terminal domain-containing protein [Oceanospirillum sediminis]|uniref:ParB N-terminal domain-containing protein n=1 Tax=Oceanospirillum sediminis TaxID=2760088 RepID=A0A839IR85_9GAMM|nr:ParB N-terminal domain-containing protein [Oceanospirillum sediminis]MBB1486726.1 ParB N-terminal domain-containing protein [Oceanospirillum sediminis]
MYAQIDKSKKNKIRATANPDTKKKSNENQKGKFADNRPKSIQMQPIKQEDGTFRDSDYPGMLLTRNVNESNEYQTYYDATNISNPATVTYEDNEYYNLADNETWYPLYNHIVNNQNCYICRQFNNIVNIADINYEGVGNEQEWKKVQLRKSIDGGIIPAITVSRADGGRYDLINGRNRIAVSQEAGYQKIPIIIQGG